VLLGGLGLVAVLTGGSPGGLLLPRALAGSELLARTDLLARSQLLDSVRRNEARAQGICNRLRTLKGQGVPYTSPQANSTIAAQEGVSLMEAEVLITYVVDRHCPDVR
jgi:hypothetical protein